MEGREVVELHGAQGFRKRGYSSWRGRGATGGFMRPTGTHFYITIQVIGRHLY